MSLRPATEFPSMTWASSLSSTTSLVLKSVSSWSDNRAAEALSEAGAAVLDAAVLDAAVTAVTLPLPW